MSKKPIVDKGLIRKVLGVILFVTGVAVLIADAWIEHIRCVTAGVIIMILSILAVIDHKYPKKATVKQAVVQGAIF